MRRISLNGLSTVKRTAMAETGHGAIPRGVRGLSDGAHVPTSRGGRPNSLVEVVRFALAAGLSFEMLNNLSTSRP
jgi:hypothetical protein